MSRDGIGAVENHTVILEEMFSFWINQWWVINNLLKVTSFFAYVLFAYLYIQ